MDISDEEIETFITENRNPLIEKKEKLKKMIRTMTFVKIGEMYGVSDNAIRKWCDKFSLPRKSSEIKKYSDDDWSKI